MVRANYDDFVVAMHANPFDIRKSWGINPLDLCAQLLDGALTDLLSNHDARRCYTKQHLSAALI